MLQILFCLYIFNDKIPHARGGSSSGTRIRLMSLSSRVRQYTYLGAPQPAPLKMKMKKMTERAKWDSYSQDKGRKANVIPDEPRQGACIACH